MNFLDIIIIGAVVIFGVLGAYSGLLRQLSTPVALIGAWLLSWMVEKPVGEQLRTWFDSELVAQYAAATIAFSISFLVIKIVWAMVAARVAANQILKPGNRALGALLGVGKGLVLSCLVVLLLMHIGKPGLRQQSMCAGAVYEGYQWFCDTDFCQRTAAEINAVMENKVREPSFKAKVQRFLQDTLDNIRSSDDTPAPAANTINEPRNG